MRHNPSQKTTDPVGVWQKLNFSRGIGAVREPPLLAGQSHEHEFWSVFKIHRLKPMEKETINNQRKTAN